MKKNQLFSIAACALYVVALIEIFENGFTSYAIILLAFGSTMLALNAKKK